METAITKHVESSEHDTRRVMAVFVLLVFACLAGIFVRIQTAKPRTSETTKTAIATVTETAEKNTSDIASLQEQLNQLLAGQREIKATMSKAMANGSKERATIRAYLEEMNGDDK